MTIADIQIVDIESELARLWDSRQEKDHIKACLCTLVVYTPDSNHAGYLKNIVQALIEKFPCRIIFIQSDRSPDANFLHVSVSNAIVGQGKVSIACDQISIEASSNQMSRVPFIVLPHLVADLPIYLLWGQDPTTESVIFPTLQTFATRLIFDSSGISNLPAFSRRMRALMDSQKNLALMDMNWGKIYGWREALSQVFDSAVKSQQLRVCKSIQIRYNDKKDGCGQHGEMQVIYLIGWLAAQMQWKFTGQEKDGNRRSLFYTNGVNACTVTLLPQTDQALPSGALLQIDVASADNTFFTIAPMCQLPKVIVHISTLEKCELPFTLPLPDLKRGSSLIKTMLYYETSEHYRNMLQAIENILP